MSASDVDAAVERAIRAEVRKKQEAYRSQAEAVTARNVAAARAEAAEAKLARIAEGVAELQQSDDRAWVSNIGDGLALILNEGTETNG